MSFLVIIFYIIIFLVIFTKNKKKQNRSGTTVSSNKYSSNSLSNNNFVGNSAKKQTTGNRLIGRQQKQTSNVPFENKSSFSSGAKISYDLRDDLKGDWMAQQLREERASLGRINAMFGFSMDKKYGSDAELLKAFHTEHCDAAGVDTAAGK